MNPMMDGYVPPCPSPTVNALAGFVAGLLLARWLVPAVAAVGARWFGGRRTP